MKSGSRREGEGPLRGRERLRKTRPAIRRRSAIGRGPWRGSAPTGSIAALIARTVLATLSRSPLPTKRAGRNPPGITMPSSDSLSGQWLGRKEWRGPFEEALRQHLGPACTNTS